MEQQRDRNGDQTAHQSKHQAEAADRHCGPRGLTAAEAATHPLGDALAPQVQALVRRIGDLAVILLTQVLGRAIGLVGRGIAQGMGRSFGRG